MSPIEPPVVWQKRAFDLVVGTLCALLCLPVFAFFILLIFVEHCLRGRPLDPLFYSERRISRGTLFTFYKFNLFDQRIVEAYRREHKFIHTKDLERSGNVTLVGKLLKQIYLDELPQLYNVLRGEMSLVGPRPLNPEVFTKLAQSGTPPIALLKGGMTGNFQSRKDTNGTSAVALDTEYLRIVTERGGWHVVFTDLTILLRTLKVIARAKGV